MSPSLVEQTPKRPWSRTPALEEALHRLLAIALVEVVIRNELVTPYLVAIVAVSIPTIDDFSRRYLLTKGSIGGPLWTHRSVTHSILVGQLIVGIAAHFDQGVAAALGFAAAVVPDICYGGVKRFLPFSAVVVGVDWGNGWSSGIVGLGSGVTILLFASQLIRIDPQLTAPSGRFEPHDDEEPAWADSADDRHEGPW